MSSAKESKRLVVGISGASGAILGIELLRAMQSFADWETHLVISKGAAITIGHETPYSLDEVKALAHTVYPLENIGASIASGTFKTEGMVVVPCSMKTVAGIANGLSLNLLLRAADVMLKERRKLVLVARESPLSGVHLHNMTLAASYGAIILPPVLTFYNRPHSIDDMIRHMVGKILDVFGLELPSFARWDGDVRPLRERDKP
jgi:polyprenyl P-hydroxybenzoate/phenylacrylic acid decarboxylase-like protein